MIDHVVHISHILNLSDCQTKYDTASAARLQLAVTEAEIELPDELDCISGADAPNNGDGDGDGLPPTTFFAASEFRRQHEAYV